MAARKAVQAPNNDWSDNDEELLNQLQSRRSAFYDEKRKALDTLIDEAEPDCDNSAISSHMQDNAERYIAALEPFVV